MICQTNFAFWPFPKSPDIPAIYVLKFVYVKCDIVCITQVLEAEDIASAVMYILGAPHRMQVLY